MSANDRQVGGEHYAQGGEFQHWDLIEDYGLGYLEGCATKYLTRWRRKGGVEDLSKALHYVEKLLEISGYRGPRGRVPERVVREFARLNYMLPDEEAIVQILCQWREWHHLADARRLIMDLIEAQSAEQA